MIYLTLSGYHSREILGLVGAPQKAGLFNQESIEMSTKYVNALRQ